MNKGFRHRALFLSAATPANKHEVRTDTGREILGTFRDDQMPTLP